MIRKAASKGVLKVKLPKSLRKGKKKPRVRLRLVLADPSPAVPPAPGPPAPPAPPGPPGPTGPTVGQIVLVHDSQPDDPQDFAYTAGGGLSPTSFSLDDDADGTLSNSRTFADVPAGSGYSLAQAAPGGWDKASATCDDGSPVTNIDLSGGETVTCTFTDTNPFPGGGYPLIAAAGDIACDPSDVDYGGGNGTATNCRHKFTAPLLAGSDAVLTIGDEGYGGTALDDTYDPTWGAYKSITHPIPGDHEYEDVGINSYAAYFGSAAGTGPGYYYSFDIGSWHVVALNSMCEPTHTFYIDCTAETTWLQADLAASNAQCTLLYWHHPHFTDGPHIPDEEGSTLPFWNAAIADGADIVLHGNDHSYQRWPKMDASGAASATGMREFVVGTGGKSHTTPTGTGATVRNGDTFGVLKLRLKPTGYDWKFIPEAGKTFTDEGTDTCS